MVINKSLTVVIPTRNRPYLVKNQIRYYSKIEIPYRVIYIDASDLATYEKNLESLKKFGRNIECDIFRASSNNIKNPALRINEQFREILHEINTPFVCQSGDDDFFIPKGLENTVKELRNNPELSACGGYCIQAMTRNDNHPTQDSNSAALSVWSMANSLSDSAYQRVRNFVARFANVSFSVKRTAVWKDCYEAFSDDGLESGLIELLMSTVVLAQGKVKRGNNVLMMRHYHHRNDDIGRKDDSYNVFDPAYGERIDKFISQIGRIFDAYSVDRPDEWQKEMELAVRFMSLNATKQGIAKLTDAWNENKFAPIQSASEVANKLGHQPTIKSALQTIADNTLNGLSDPATRSFSMEGLKS
jgi:glycosyltransferase domain-containing protein